MEGREELTTNEYGNIDIHNMKLSSMEYSIYVVSTSIEHRLYTQRRYES